MASLLVALGSIVACTELPDVSAGVCGNGIVDPGEDCDGADYLGNPCGEPDALTYACRLECLDPAESGALADAEPRDACPTGWGCGADGICRAWSGELESLDAFEVDVRQIAIADFDGDGAGDIVTVGSSGVVVHYFDAGELAESAVVGAPDQVPAIGDLTGDGRADLVLALGVGVGVKLGQEDRSLESVVFTSFEVETPPGQIVPLTVPLTGPIEDAQLAGDDVFLVTEDGVMAFNGEEWTPKWTSTVGKLSIGEPIPMGDLIQETGPRCEEMVLGAGPEPGRVTRLVLYSPCADVTMPPIVDLGEQSIGGPVQILDLDQDMSLDVIFAIQVDPGSTQSSDVYDLAVMYGDGTGAFSSGGMAPGPCRQASIMRGAFSTICAGPLRPLALGDLDRDGIIDAIEPCAIHVSGGLGPQPACPEVKANSPPDVFNAEAPWSTARIADLNGDGLPDGIAASKTSSGLFFFRGTGTPALNPTVIPTLRKVQEISLGDFDGDSLADVAVHEREDDGDDESAFLSVAFSAPLSAPAPPVGLGPIPFAAQLFTTDMGIASPSLDTMADLGLLVRPRGTPRARVAVFPGNAARLMQSTLFLGEPELGGDLLVPKRAAIGQLVTSNGSATSLDLGVLAVRPNDVSISTVLWRVPLKDPPPDSAAGAVDPAMQPTTFGTVLPGTLGFTARVGAVRLDGGADALVIVGLARQTSAGPREALLVVAAPCEGPCTEELLLGSEITSVGDLAISDVDGDGREDVSVLLNGDGISHVRVLWNRGTGTLALDPGTLIELPVDEPDRTITTFGWLDVDADAPGGTKKEALVLTKTRAYLARLKEDLSFAIEPWTKIPRGGGGRPTGGGRGGTGVAVGDVDGDGLEDLVLADVASVEVLRAIPRTR